MVMTPLQILANSPTAEQATQTHAMMAAWSKKFAVYGDPRTWEQKALVMDDVLDFAWKSGTDRMVATASYDEWAIGGWNDMPGVVKPD